MIHKRLTDNEKIEIVQAYQDNMTLQELSKKYKIHRNNITGILKRRGINIRPQVYFRLHTFNEKIFDIIDDEEKSYWLGFILGDGSVNHKGLSVGLATRDIDHLYKLKIFFNGTNNIFSRKDKHFETIIFYSKYLVNTLNYHGIVQNKTYQDIRTPKTIPIKLLRHFYRGLFDADGWVYCHKYNNSKHNQHGFGCCSHNYDFMDEVKIWINNQLGYQCGYINDRYRAIGSAAELSLKGNKVYKDIYQLLYTDATIYLNRKYIKATNFYNKLI